MILASFCEWILIKLHTNDDCDNIWDKLAFQHCRSEFKVTVAFDRGFITFSDSLVSDDIYGFIIFRICKLISAIY